MFTINRKSLKSIHDIACDGWKIKILKMINVWEDEITLTYDQVKEMFDAADTTQKKTLKKVFPEYETKKTIINRIKTIDDVLNELGLEYDEIVPWKKPKNKAQKSQNALALLQCVSQCYNEGTKLDFLDTNQQKWFNYFEKKSRGGWFFDGSGCYGYCYCYSCVPFALLFKSKELAEDAAKKFKDLYIDYLPE